MNYKAKFDKPKLNNQCRLCGKNDKTINHICKKISFNSYCN